MASDKMKQQLLKRKRELEEQLKPYEELKDELAEVNKLLDSYDRGGWEKPGHPNGCRCRECDPSW